MELKIFSNNHGLNLVEYQNLIKEYIKNKTIDIIDSKQRLQEEKNISDSIKNWINNNNLTNDEVIKRNEYKNNLEQILRTIKTWFSSVENSSNSSKIHQFYNLISKNLEKINK